MGQRLIFDIETDGIPLEEITKIHCLAIKDIDTGQEYRFRHNDEEDTIEHGVYMLNAADLIIGHNIIKYDIPVIKKFFPWFQPKKVFDTICGTRLVYTDVKDRDFKRFRAGKLPGNMIGRHSLEAWGYRLGDYKGDFKGPWDQWTPEMDNYCLQDITVTHTLYNKLMDSGFSEESFELEMEVAKIIYRQEQHGFLFNRAAAAELYAKLAQRRDELTVELRAVFPPWETRTQFIPKVNNKKRGYVKGVPTYKVKIIDFNPGSRQHIGKALIDKYNWKPKSYTEDGHPEISEEILDKLKYPEAKLFSEYLMLDKRIGQLAEGDQAWLKCVQKDGKIHGRVETNGTVTGRMSHSKPNVAQVPSVKSPYGAECRALFVVPSGKKLIGADASGLELRCLAHYLAIYDGGAYANEVVNGDVHTMTQKVAGLATRDQAKILIYATLYGAGDAKIGSQFGAGPAKGREIREKLFAGIPALQKLISDVKAKARSKRVLKGVDGRLLRVRSEHAALNVLLQSCGAIIMKRALVILDTNLQAAGLVPGQHYEFVANIHDEFQIQADTHLAEFIGQAAVRAIEQAGEHFRFRCKLTGEYKIGSNWKETH